MLIGVVAHVEREDLASRLIRETQADVWKFDDGVPSVKGCADNHIRVLTELNKHAENDRWCVVLEDDARPVADFRRQLNMALAQVDNPLVGLYLGDGNLNGETMNAVVPAVAAAKASDSHWIVADWFISTVGYAVRSAWLPAMLAGISDVGGPVDMRINRWTQRFDMQTWYPQPSLVDHRDERSVIAPDLSIQPRRAHRFGSRTEWDCSTVEMKYADPWGRAYL